MVVILVRNKGPGSTPYAQHVGILVRKEETAEGRDGPRASWNEPFQPVPHACQQSSTFTRSYPKDCRERVVLPHGRGLGSGQYTKGTRVLISLCDSLMFGRVPGTRPNISESHSEISTRVPFCIAPAARCAHAHPDLLGRDHVRVLERDTEAPRRRSRDRDCQAGTGGRPETPLQPSPCPNPVQWSALGWSEVPSCVA